MEITKEQIELVKLSITIITAIAGGFGGLLTFFLRNISQQLKSIREELSKTREQQVENRAEIASVKTMVHSLPCRFPVSHNIREIRDDRCQKQHTN